MSGEAHRLLAIVAVEPAKRVRCQQPHCGHSVYARIHVVEDSGSLLVLGADCFAKRYGVASTTGFKGFGGGSGRVLTEAERELLLNNTSALLAQFESERAKELERVAAKMESLRQLHAARQQQTLENPYRQDLIAHRLRGERNRAVPRSSTSSSPPQQMALAPLPRWAAFKKQNTSFFAYGVAKGQCWVLMQSASHDGCFIAPAPVPFESWDEALPPSIGAADVERSVYVSQRHVNELTAWFSQRCSKGTRIDSDAWAIQQFALRI